MAIPIIPIVMALGSMASSYFQSRAQKKANESNERLAREQQAWNQKMWQEQNVYNDPSAQMERLKGAGLNPRLIYGSSSGQAAGNAGDVKGYDRAENKAQWQGTSAFNDFVQFRQMEAQTDNTKAMTEVNQQEAANKAQELLNKKLDNEVKGFNYGISKELRETNINAARANADAAMSNALKSEADADVSVNTKDARIRNAQISVKKSIATLEGQQLENKLKQIAIQMRKDGVNESDNVMLRMLAQKGVLQSLTDKGVNFLKLFKELGDEYDPAKLLKN